MLKAVSNILNLLFYQLFLLLLYIKLSFAIICESKIIDVFDEFLCYVSEALKATCQQEESFDIILSASSYGSL